MRPDYFTMQREAWRTQHRIKIYSAVSRQTECEDMNLFLQQESPSAEMVMLERLFLQAERYTLAEDRRRARRDPGEQQPPCSLSGGLVFSFCHKICRFISPDWDRKSVQGKVKSVALSNFPLQTHLSAPQSTALNLHICSRAAPRCECVIKLCKCGAGSCWEGLSVMMKKLHVRG